MDKLHKSLWKVSNKRPFDFIKNMKTYLGEELFVRSLLMCDWAVFFINAFPKGQKILYSMKDIFSSSPHNKEEWKKRELYRKKIKKYYPESSGCFCMTLTGDGKRYFTLSGVDYQGQEFIDSEVDVKKYEELAKCLISELKLKGCLYCSLNHYTKSYTEITKHDEPIIYIKNEPNFIYFCEYIKNEVKYICIAYGAELNLRKMLKSALYAKHLFQK